jgi:hypothetical protein
MMSFSMRKWKGNKLQQSIVNIILYCFPSLRKEDVVSTPEGVNGADVILSDKAKELFPYKVEAKNHNRIKALYDYFQQAEGHQGDEEPLLVFKSDKRPPLAIIHLNHFIDLVAKQNNPERKQNEETKN